jgi:Peptidase propeptide and YPEB domain
MMEETSVRGTGHGRARTAPSVSRIPARARARTRPRHHLAGACYMGRLVLPGMLPAVARGLLVVLALLAGTPTASAGSAAGGGWSLVRVAERHVSLEQAVAIVQRATGGRVLDARAHGDFYRIKVLTRDGVVRVLDVDARTGAIR